MRYFLLFVITTLLFTHPVFAATAKKAVKKTTQEIRFENTCKKIVKEAQRGAKKIPDKLVIDPKNVKSGFQSAYRTALRKITQKQENARRSKKKLNLVKKGKLTEQGVKELCKIVVVALLKKLPPPPPAPPPSPGPGSTGSTNGSGKKILFQGKKEKVSAEQLHKNYEDSPHRYRLRVFGDGEFKSVFDDPDVNVRFVLPCGYFVNSKLQKVDIVFVDKKGTLSDDFGDAVEWRYNIPGECAEALITIQITDIKSGAILSEKSGIEISWF